MKQVGMEKESETSGCSDPGGECVCWGAAKRDGIIQFFKVCSLTRRLHCINWWQLLAPKILACRKLNRQVDSDGLGRNVTTLTTDPESKSTIS